MSNLDKQTITFEEMLNKTGYIVYSNIGSSMMPLIKQGRDILQIKKKGNERFNKYDVVLYKINNRYILHRIIEVRDKDYVIVGDNSNSKEYGITDDQILGILVGINRNGKPLNLNGLGYKLYVHLWCDFYPIRSGVINIRDLYNRILGKTYKIYKKYIKKA